MSSLKDIYATHHKVRRQRGFSILKDERGMLLKDIVGSGKQVLDIGCRDGALTKYFITGNTVLGADIDTNALEEAQKLGIETLMMDLNGDWRELSSRKFDAVVAGEVLEHLYYPANVAQKVKERLNEGGVFAGSVPNAFSLINRLRYLAGRKKGTPLEDPTHINQFHINELKKILGQHFREVKVVGLGRHAKLAKLAPGIFAFGLFFICRA